MLIEKTIFGAWRISDIIDGALVTRQYFDYTKREAIAEFKREMRQRQVKF